ncbi:MAG: glycoside hydrolase family 127 protein [Anaerolineae bacterium]|nr:glycoside hydrolase family 127 protein [Anaerolineae bacterium]
MESSSLFIAPSDQARIDDAFWNPRLRVNAETAIYHQWEQLERTGCIENFRLVADGKEGFREGYFFADSDAFKWLDAAARIYASHPSERLKALMDDFIALIGRAQAGDGYLYTYNQCLFPETRWTNLQIEHELYCHGHLIEAGVSHFEATGKRALLEIAIKAADLLVQTFAGAGPEGTPGHEEVEIALIRLYRATGHPRYLDLAEHFVEQRGRIPGFFFHILRQNQSVGQRDTSVRRRRAAYVATHPEHARMFQLPPDNTSPKPPWGGVRFFLNAGTGKYFQQHRPVRQQVVPVGHAVRFAYLETAIAMLAQHTGDPTLLEPLAAAWERMVTRRMYVTGGIGSLPNIEGFGRDDELDPVVAYAETCAALGSMLWAWEMTRITRQARYADLFEWQLYNAAAVGIGQDGASYLYNNPLASHGGLTRVAWFKCPCCPSNVSRVWADLGRFIYSFDGADVWVHQYVGSQVGRAADGRLAMASRLPWDGTVELTLDLAAPAPFTIHLRIPSWCSTVDLRVNGAPVAVDRPPSPGVQTASGYSPHASIYVPVTRTWSPGDVVALDFEMPIRARATSPRVKATRGQVAITRGPLVYCLESIDNPDVDLFAVRLDPTTLQAEFSTDHFGGVTLVRGQTVGGEPLIFIPYFLWANRGESHMTVYVDAKN